MFRRFTKWLGELLHLHPTNGVRIHIYRVTCSENILNSNHDIFWYVKNFFLLRQYPYVWRQKQYKQPCTYIAWTYECGVRAPSTMLHSNIAMFTLDGCIKIKTASRNVQIYLHKHITLFRPLPSSEQNNIDKLYMRLFIYISYFFSYPFFCHTKNELAPMRHSALASVSYPSSLSLCVVLGSYLLLLQLMLNPNVDNFGCCYHHIFLSEWWSMQILFTYQNIRVEMVPDNRCRTTSDYTEE